MVLSFHEPAEKDVPTLIQYMGDAFIRRLSAARQLFPWSSKMVREIKFAPNKSQGLSQVY
jgi:hypothetical protein